jgi:hypothetical protein
MLAAFGGGKAHVAARLARHSVAENLQSFREIGAGKIPRELHAEMTSSRTK